MQLPDFVQDKIYSEFLFKSFLVTFRDTFTIPKDKTETYTDHHGNVRILKKNYNWTDQLYRNFMMEVLTNLEPRHELKGKVLFEELEEISEIIFISKGNIDIGYEINK